MTQNYADARSVAWSYGILSPGRIRMLVLCTLSLLFSLYVVYLFNVTGKPATVAPGVTLQQPPSLPPSLNDAPPVQVIGRTDSVATVVAKALYFKSLLTTTAQINALQYTYSSSLARKWSNLPCTNTCRNGISLGTGVLTSAQLAAALDVIKAALGTSTYNGYNQFMAIRYADKYLGLNGGGGSYDSANYYLAYLNTPSTTGAWMLQVGGHHQAINIAYNAGKVVGATPFHLGVEPTSFSLGGTTYTPLKLEHDSFANMLAGLTTAQLTTAKLSSTYGDCVMIPGETNGGTSTFPSKAGLLCNVLSSTQKSLVYAAMKNYTDDLDDSTANVLQNLFISQIDSTYIGWTGSGTSGTASTFLNANTNYVRLDGPRVWIEFVCQNGVVFSGIHYHSVFRDHSRDYGNDLAATTLPVTLLSFDARANGKSRLLNWTTSNEYKAAYFEVQRSANPSSGYTTLTKVRANNTSKNSYAYTDADAVDEATIYYRLNMIDADGKNVYSNVVAVKQTPATTITLYPNPAKDVITVSNVETLTNATINVINSAGKTVLHSANRSGRNLNVDISALPAGSYIVQIAENGKTTNLKFIKQK